MAVCSVVHTKNTNTAVWAERRIGESETEVVWNAVAQLVQALRYKPKVEGFVTGIFH